MDSSPCTTYRQPHNENVTLGTTWRMAKQPLYDNNSLRQTSRAAPNAGMGGHTLPLLTVADPVIGSLLTESLSCVVEWVRVGGFKNKKRKGSLSQNGRGQEHFKETTITLNDML